MLKEMNQNKVKFVMLRLLVVGSNSLKQNIILNLENKNSNLIELNQQPIYNNFQLLFGRNTLKFESKKNQRNR